MYHKNAGKYRLLPSIDQHILYCCVKQWTILHEANSLPICPILHFVPSPWAHTRWAPQQGMQLAKMFLMSKGASPNHNLYVLSTYLPLRRSIAEGQENVAHLWWSRQVSARWERHSPPAPLRSSLQSPTSDKIPGLQLNARVCTQCLPALCFGHLLRQDPWAVCLNCFFIMPPLHRILRYSCMMQTT